MFTATQEPCLLLCARFQNTNLKTHDMPFLKPMFCHVSSFNLIMQNVFKFAKANQIAEELDRSQCFFVDIPHTETRSAGDEFGH